MRKNVREGQEARSMERRIAAEKARQRQTLPFSGVIAFAKPLGGVEKCTN